MGRNFLRGAATFGVGVLLVGGIIAVLLGIQQLLSGNVSAQNIGAVVFGALLVVALLSAWRVIPWIDAKVLLGGFSGVMYFFLFFPIAVVIIYSFNANRTVTVWGGFSTKWFGRALNNPDIIASIVRSFDIAFVNMIAATVLGTAAALALGKAKQRVRAPFDILVFLALVVPEIVIALGLALAFNSMKFELGLVAMFLGHMLFNVSLVLLIVRARFVSMGSGLEEASFDLGAPPLRTFRQVTLPRLMPAIISGAMLSFTFSFDDVVISSFLAGAGHDTWPLYIFNSIKFGLSPELNATATMMLAATLVVLGVGALIMRKIFADDGESGSVGASVGGVG